MLENVANMLTGEWQQHVMAPGPVFQKRSITLVLISLSTLRSEDILRDQKC